jgi:hypothetical protein
VFLTPGQCAQVVELAGLAARDQSRHLGSAKDHGPGIWRVAVAYGDSAVVIVCDLNAFTDAAEAGLAPMKDLVVDGRPLCSIGHVLVPSL